MNINFVDKKNLFRFLDAAPSHIAEILKKPAPKFRGPKADSVCVFGMGGSAISGLILQDILGYYSQTGISVNNRERIHLRKDTLYIPVSYSGTTRETLNTLNSVRKGIVAGISSKKDFTPETFTVPGGLPPRFAFFYIFSALIRVVSEHFDIKGMSGDLEEAVPRLKTFKENLKKNDSQAHLIADSLGGKPVLIYAPSCLRHTAYRWKTQFNENSKTHAFSNFFPELTHNEIVPYINGEDLFSVIVLRSKFETDAEKLQMDFFSERADFNIDITAGNILQEVLKYVLLGDFISYYLAVRKGIDPYPIEMIDSLKRRLSENGH